MSLINLGTAPSGSDGDTNRVSNGKINLMPGALVFNVKSQYGAKGDGSTDDTAAINAASAAAFNAGGGIVFFPDGHYICIGAFDATTNSILTLPQNITYSDPPTIYFIGNARGFLESGNNAVAAVGVTLNFSGHPTASGTLPSAFAAAPNVQDTFTNWECAAVVFDNMLIVVESNPTINGLNFNNCLQMVIGDFCRVFSLWTSSSAVQPTHGTTGIICPREHNNIASLIGQSEIVGFANGIQAGEHLVMRRPIIAFCGNALVVNSPLTYAQHLISGSMCIESCNSMVNNKGTGVQSLALVLQCEVSQSGWFAGVAGEDVIDTSNLLYGKLDYACLSNSTGNPLPLGIDGGRNLLTYDLYQALPVNGAPHAALMVQSSNTNQGTPLGVASSAPLQAGLGSFTVFAFVKANTAVSTLQPALGKWSDGTNSKQEYLLYWANGSTKFSFTVGDALGGEYAANGTTTPTTSTWYFLVGEFNVTTGNINLYVNNALEATTTAVTQSGTADFEIGGAQANPLWALDGPVAMVGKYSSVSGQAISASLMTFLYNGGKGQTAADILAKTGLTAPDFLYTFDSSGALGTDSGPNNITLSNVFGTGATQTSGPG